MNNGSKWYYMQIIKAIMNAFKSMLFIMSKATRFKLAIKLSEKLSRQGVHVFLCIEKNSFICQSIYLHRSISYLQ